MLPERAAVVAEVTAVFHEYEAALVANQLDVLDARFWGDERLVRFAFGDVQHGGAEVRAARRALPRQTPPRTVERLSVYALADDVAVASAECRLDADGTRVLQTQVWTRVEGTWQVTAAHVSAHPD
jgi:hypothetical protein